MTLTHKPAPDWHLTSRPTLAVAKYGTKNTTLDYDLTKRSPIAHSAFIDNLTHPIEIQGQLLQARAAQLFQLLAARPRDASRGGHAVWGADHQAQLRQRRQAGRGLQSSEKQVFSKVRSSFQPDAVGRTRHYCRG